MCMSCARSSAPKIRPSRCCGVAVQIECMFERARADSMRARILMGCWLGAWLAWFAGLCGGGDDGEEGEKEGEDEEGGGGGGGRRWVIISDMKWRSEAEWTLGMIRVSIPSADLADRSVVRSSRAKPLSTALMRTARSRTPAGRGWDWRNFNS